MNNLSNVPNTPISSSEDRKSIELEGSLPLEKIKEPYSTQQFLSCFNQEKQKKEIENQENLIKAENWVKKFSWENCTFRSLRRFLFPINSCHKLNEGRFKDSNPFIFIPTYALSWGAGLSLTFSLNKEKEDSTSVNIALGYAYFVLGCPISDIISNLIESALGKCKRAKVNREQVKTMCKVNALIQQLEPFSDEPLKTENLLKKLIDLDTSLGLRKEVTSHMNFTQLITFAESTSRDLFQTFTKDCLPEHISSVILFLLYLKLYPPSAFYLSPVNSVIPLNALHPDFASNQKKHIINILFQMEDEIKNDPSIWEEIVKRVPKSYFEEEELQALLKEKKPSNADLEVIEEQMDSLRLIAESNNIEPKNLLLHFILDEIGTKTSFLIKHKQLKKYDYLQGREDSIKGSSQEVIEIQESEESEEKKEEEQELIGSETFDTVIDIRDPIDIRELLELDISTLSKKTHKYLPEFIAFINKSECLLTKKNVPFILELTHFFDVKECIVYCQKYMIHEKQYHTLEMLDVLLKYTDAQDEQLYHNTLTFFTSLLKTFSEKDLFISFQKALKIIEESNSHFENEPKSKTNQLLEEFIDQMEATISRFTIKKLCQYYKEVFHCRVFKNIHPKIIDVIVAFIDKPLFSRHLFLLETFKGEEAIFQALCKKYEESLDTRISFFKEFWEFALLNQVDSLREACLTLFSTNSSKRAQILDLWDFGKYPKEFGDIIKKENGMQC